MYVAHQFRLEPEDALRRAAERGVGEFVTQGAEGLDATLLPFLVRERDGVTTLETHMARVNPQWRDREALVVVTCAESHVAGTDMPPEPAGARYPRVPTWNYLTVHVRGELVAHDVAQWKERHVREFAERFEDEWRIGTHTSPELARHAFAAIVGVEVRVREVVGKAKLSQGLGSADLAHTIGVLRARGTADAGAVADLMAEISVPYVAAREGRMEDARRSAPGPRGA